MKALNPGQARAFHSIRKAIDAVQQKPGDESIQRLYFVEGEGGTGRHLQGVPELRQLFLSQNYGNFFRSKMSNLSVNAYPIGSIPARAKKMTKGKLFVVLHIF